MNTDKKDLSIVQMEIVKKTVFTPALAGGARVRVHPRLIWPKAAIL
jgi:hypothetical protein